MHCLSRKLGGVGVALHNYHIGLLFILALACFFTIMIPFRLSELSVARALHARRGRGEARRGDGVLPV